MVAKENLLPQALLLELCLANPDAVKDDGFLKFLQYEMKPAMPAYMINLIKSKWNEKTLRTQMEEELGKLAFNRDFFCNRMISNLAHDSTAKPDELRNLLLSRGTLNDYFFAAETCLQEENYKNAFSILQDYISINEKRLSKLTAIEIEHYCNYLSWLQKLSGSKRNIYQLEKSDLSDLKAYVENSIGRGRILAHNILCGLYGICIEDGEDGANGSGGSGNEITPNDDVPIAAREVRVRVFPNPAKEYTSFIWDFETGANGQKDGGAKARMDEGAKARKDEGAKGKKSDDIGEITNALLTISDQTGKPIAVKSLTGSTGQWIWETSAIPTGNYLYRVTANGTQLESGKIVVTK
jgi:hypothetical protein